ncbi:MAG: protoheme IX farnesyltransferase [Candidatus Marinimicrobia bacterium]|nr:protoheme IX farnesyltransferase [Candidatus Neomarinimicrobiota bacterium]
MVFLFFSNSNSQIWLRRYSKFTAFSTLGLIFAGGMVTSTSSGLAVPDWPNTYGEFMFTFPLSKWVGGIFYEHLHRLIASFVGLLTLVLAFWLWRSEKRQWVKNLGWIALTAVIAQGILGGLTVLLLLPTAISITHAVLAQTFFCITIALAFFLSKEWDCSESEDGLAGRTFARWTVILTITIYIQLILGALMRHTGSGLAVVDFPLVNGAVFPVLNEALLSSMNWARFDLGLEPVMLSHVFIHLLHRFGAVMVLGAATFVTLHASKHHRYEDRLFLPVLFIDLLLLTQIFLAALVIWSAKAPIITTFHVWVGALLLGASFFLSLRTVRMLVPSGKLRFLFQRDPDMFPTAEGWRGVASSYWELTKPRIIWLVLVATTIGFYLGAMQVAQSILSEPWPLIHTIVGTLLVASGVGVLNQYIERDADGRMKRTKTRPIPSGRVQPVSARRFGVLLSAAGVIYLLTTVTVHVALVAFLTVFLYLGVYTPLKKKTTWNTLIGAVPGALPTLGGWLAATGNLELGGWLLFGVLFLWQIPHFFAIAWLYRKDYARAGFQMLPGVESTTMTKTSLYCISFAVLLMICTTLIHLQGISGQVFLWGSLLLGGVFLALSMDAARGWNHERARRLLMGSIIYLPLLLLILVIDRSFI